MATLPPEDRGPDSGRGTGAGNGSGGETDGVGQPLPGGVVIPDDLSELSAEVLALRREQARQRRRERWGRVRRLGRGSPPGVPVRLEDGGGLQPQRIDDAALLDRAQRSGQVGSRERLDRLDRPVRPLRTGRWPTGRMSAPLVLAALALIVILGVVLSVYGPKSTVPVTPSVASATTNVPAGQIGGLVPAITLTVHGDPVPSTDLRPAVLVLVPADCPTCDASAQRLTGQASALDSTVVFIAGPTGQALASRLASEAAPGEASVALDAHASLAATYGVAPDQLTVLLVGSDGIVNDVEHGFAAGQHLSVGFRISR